MRGMDKKSEARKEKLDTHIFLLPLFSTSYAFTFPPSLPSPFHLALFHKVLCFFSMRHLLWASASPSFLFLKKDDPLGFVFALYIERQKDDPLSSTGAYYIRTQKACRYVRKGLPLGASRLSCKGLAVCACRAVRIGRAVRV